MATIHVFGRSDDLVHVFGENSDGSKVAGSDEYYYSESKGFSGILRGSDGGQMAIFVDYRDNGVWTVALGQVDEDIEFPDWPVSYAVNGDLCEYSITATIEAPDGSIFTKCHF